MNLSSLFLFFWLSNCITKSGISKVNEEDLENINDRTTMSPVSRSERKTVVFDKRRLTPWTTKQTGTSSSPLTLGRGRREWKGNEEGMRRRETWGVLGYQDKELGVCDVVCDVKESTESREAGRREGGWRRKRIEPLFTGNRNWGRNYKDCLPSFVSRTRREAEKEREWFPNGKLMDLTSRESRKKKVNGLLL